jgi:tellurite resistance protein TerC
VFAVDSIPAIFAIWSLAFTATTLAVTMLLSLRMEPSGRGGGAYPFAGKREDGRAEGR